MLHPADIERAAERLRGRVHATPLQSFRSAARHGGELHLKCENLQKTGAFKARGALHYLLCWQDSKPGERGVCTYSSGNHGAALAWAANQLGIPCKVFVPTTIPASKERAILGYGGQVVHAGTTSLQRREAAEAVADREELHIVPPFDHLWIMAGQGTAGLEIVAQLPEVEEVFVPVGGGGLLAGVATAVRATVPAARIVGVEPEAAASMHAALAAGGPCPIELGATIADGLCPVQAGALCHAVAAEKVDEVVRVSDAELKAALTLLLERAHLWVEPSGAAGLAGYLQGRRPGRRSVVLLSGGNMDAARLCELDLGSLEEDRNA